MRTLSIVGVLALLVGCSHAKGLGKDDVQLLHSAPEVRLWNQPVGNKTGQLATQTFVNSPGPFGPTVAPWQGGRTPPGAESLYDPTPVLGNDLLTRLRAAGLAAPEGATTTESLSLEVKVDAIQLDTGTDGYTLNPFQASARLKNKDARVLWEGACMITPTSGGIPPADKVGVVVQSLIDRAALACGEHLASEFKGALGAAEKKK